LHLYLLETYLSVEVIPGAHRWNVISEQSDVITISRSRT